MELIITINLDNDAFNGRNKSVRETARILTEWIATCKEMGRLNDQRLRDINGNSVGDVTITEG